MGKLLLLILLVTVLKCHGQRHNFGGFAPAAQRQLNGALGIASSIFGGITAGFGLNLGGQAGQKRPQNNNDQYPNTQQNIPDGMGGGGNNNYKPQYYPQRPQQPSRPSQNYQHTHRPNTQYSPRPEDYENQGQYQGYPNNGYNNGYNNYNNNPSYSDNVRPVQPSQNYPGNFNNNQNYGNQYPSEQNFGNNPGYNNGYNNNVRPNNNNQANPVNINNQFSQNGQERPVDGNSQSNNVPGYGNNNNNDYNQEELLNQIFGTAQNPNTELNSDAQNPSNGESNTGTLNPNNGGFNSGTQNPNNLGNQYPSNGGLTSGTLNSNNGVFNQNTFNQDKVTKNPKEDLPTFVALTPTEVTKETESSKPGEEEFDIDIRVKDQ